MATAFAVCGAAALGATSVAGSAVVTLPDGVSCYSVSTEDKCTRSWSIPPASPPLCCPTAYSPASRCYVAGVSGSDPAVLVWPIASTAARLDKDLLCRLSLPAAPHTILPLPDAEASVAVLADGRVALCSHATQAVTVSGSGRGRSSASDKASAPVAVLAARVLPGDVVAVLEASNGAAHASLDFYNLAPMEAAGKAPKLSKRCSLVSVGSASAPSPRSVLAGALSLTSCALLWSDGRLELYSFAVELDALESAGAKVRSHARWTVPLAAPRVEAARTPGRKRHGAKEEAAGQVQAVLADAGEGRLAVVYRNEQDELTASILDWRFACPQATVSVPSSHRSSPRTCAPAPGGLVIAHAEGVAGVSLSLPRPTLAALFGSCAGEARAGAAEEAEDEAVARCGSAAEPSAATPSGKRGRAAHASAAPSPAAAPGAALVRTAPRVSSLQEPARRTALLARCQASWAQDDAADSAETCETSLVALLDRAQASAPSKVSAPLEASALQRELDRAFAPAHLPADPSLARRALSAAAEAGHWAACETLVRAAPASFASLAGEAAGAPLRALRAGRPDFAHELLCCGGADLDADSLAGVLAFYLRSDEEDAPGRALRAWAQEHLRLRRKLAEEALAEVRALASPKQAQAPQARRPAAAAVSEPAGVDASDAPPDLALALARAAARARAADGFRARDVTLHAVLSTGPDPAVMRDALCALRPRAALRLLRCLLVWVRNHARAPVLGDGQGAAGRPADRLAPAPGSAEALAWLAALLDARLGILTLLPEAREALEAARGLVEGCARDARALERVRGVLDGLGSAATPARVERQALGGGGVYAAEWMDLGVRAG